MIGTNSKGKSDIDGLLLLPVVVQNVDQVERVKPLFHHINLLGNPTYEVSVWFVATSRRKRRFPSRSRQGVITFQAAKMIDPYLYCGPSDVFKLSGSALRNAVAGYVRKAYSNNGAWLDDRYTVWRDTPINEQTSGQVCTLGLQRSFSSFPASRASFHVLRGSRRHIHRPVAFAFVYSKEI